MNTLILCTGNSARSILAEAIFIKIKSIDVSSFSAGSQPKDEPHPAAISLLKKRGFDTSALRSKSWDEYSGPDAPQMDVVITVCDSAASEVCPIWPGAPVQVHWGLPDPAAIPAGPEQDKAFEKTYENLLWRAERAMTPQFLKATPVERSQILKHIHEIGPR